MVVARRVVVVVEWILVAGFAFFFVFLAFDIPNAWNAQPCSVKPSQGCYPWGAEGPVGGLWNYKSKQTYLASTVYDAAVSFIVLGCCLFIPQGRRIIALLIGIAAIMMSEIVLKNTFGF